MKIPTRELYINGRWRPSSSDGRLDVIDPATEQIIGSIPRGNAADVDAAVDAARNAFYHGGWSRTSGSQRAAYLRCISDKVNRAFFCDTSAVNRDGAHFSEPYR
jgi:acyl-CoA reductase-like NAD-dependent aldehyde dehydrogenase